MTGALIFAATAAHAAEPAAAVAPVQSHDSIRAMTIENAFAWQSCALGNVCFYTGSNGSGSKCEWNATDSDWTSGLRTCSWATTNNVGSVWNHGRDASYTGVAFYHGVNYTDRAGCTTRGNRGNLAGTYKLMSHQFTRGACG